MAPGESALAGELSVRRPQFPMTWSERFPRWARIVFVIFGAAIIAGGIAGATQDMGIDTILPALCVGGAWAIVGLKGGYPLVRAGQGSISAGLRVLRRRRLLAYGFPLLWAPVLVEGMLAAPPAIQTSAFCILTLPMVVVFARFALSACPRCGHHFFLPPRGRARSAAWSPHACQSCGLALRNASVSPPAV